MMNLPNTAVRAFNTPLMICPEKARVILTALGPRLLGLEEGAAVGLSGFPAAAPEGARWEARPRAGFVGDEIVRHMAGREDASAYSIIEGIAVIPVTGTLVRRGAYLGESSGMTSYEGLSAQIRLAAADARVRGIALEIDSFGGEAAGVFDLAAQVRAARAEKPVRAFLADYALSAGYAIASQAERTVIPAFGVAGSIGVVSMHVDASAALAQEGIKVTLVASGRHKTEGNPYEPLPDAVRKRMQAQNDAMWAAFADLVGEGRGNRLDAAGAIRTQAGVFTGAEAVRAGLADEVAEARDGFAQFLADLSSPVGPVRAGAQNRAEGGHGPAADGSTVCPDRADAHNPEETSMKDENITAGDQAAPNPAAARQAGMAAERERATKITQRVALAGLPSALAEQLITEGASLEVAYGRIIDAKAERATDGGEIVNHAPARVTGDAVDRTTEGLTRALLQRCGMEGGEANEFSGMSLREMARETLRARNLRAPAGGVIQLASAAFMPSMAGGVHTTSDFGNILSNIAGKAMLKGFMEADETFDQFTSTGTLTDFKATRRVGLDAFPALDLVAEGGEFTYGTAGDFSETVILGTYGKLFALSRQTIINDDLDAFSKVPARMGRAAKRTVGNLVFLVLNGNPNMGDGTALFHANHANLAGAGAVPSEITINAGIVAMATQKDRSKNTVALNVGPKFLLAPPTQRSAVLQAMNSEYAPDDTAKAGTTKQPYAYNTVRNAATPIFDARLTGTAWYLAADPAMFDTIEVSYLDGNSTPYLEQQMGWTVDGTEFKVRIDAVAKALAWEGLYKNPGA